ncbi:CAP domain-containing protein [Chlorobium sp.]|uniref:CAP domain-containing protein n=1 Tax=Chlorobium sp. TaxID=1095 RepID=UPI003C3FDA91
MRVAMYDLLKRMATGLLLAAIAAVAPAAASGGGEPCISWLAAQAAVPAKPALSQRELGLYRLLMEYRQSRGLPSIPLSESLSRVAALHVRDLELHPPSEPCNLHSWSKYGPWKSCCYRGRGGAECMWRKPGELTSYSGNGYEIAFYSSVPFTPEDVLEAWKDGSAHHAVIVNKGKWARMEWKAVGVGMSGSYAVVWFGMEPDR